MGATWASRQRASWLASCQCFCLSVCPHLLSRSRHHRRRHLSSGPLTLRSLGLWCLPLRSCRLNCQSLWTSLIGTGGWLSMGGWDTHMHRRGTGRHAARGGKSIAHTHTPGYAFMHDTFMNYLCTCMCISHTQWDRTKTSRQHKHSSRDKGLALHRVKLSQTESEGWTQNLCLHI